MTRFRQALLDELLSRVPDQPAGTPARIRSLARPAKLWLAIGGAAAAVVAATVATAAVVSMTVDPVTPHTPAPAQSPPFVVSEVDGIVTMTGDWRADPAAANQALRSATNGKAAIIPISSEADCPVTDRGTKVPSTSENMGQLRAVLMGNEDNEVRVRPADIPDEWVLVLTPGTLPRSTQPVTYVSWYFAPGPTCIAGPIPAEPEQ